jgi:hypothetical protein
MKSNRLAIKTIIKQCIICLSIVGLASCAYEMPPNQQQLAKNVQLIPSTSVLSVISQNNYKISDSGHVIEQSGLYKTVYDLNYEPDNSILIPSNALIRGTYHNDGVTCDINWTSVYAYNEEDNRNAVPLNQVTRPTICDPNKGIKTGDRLIIRFLDSTM